MDDHRLPNQLRTLLRINTISQITDLKQGYADEACTDGYSFAVPRTALENAYLTQAIRTSSEARSETLGNVWVDFNDLSNDQCWVIGADTTCPWLQESSDIQTRDIVVPSVAAVIVLVISVLTLIAKANGQSLLQYALSSLTDSRKSTSET